MAGSSFAADAKFKEVSLSAVIIRADGSVENLGVISYWHKNPLRRLAWRVYRFVMGK